jgi:hypothetical protein
MDTTIIIGIVIMILLFCSSSAGVLAYFMNDAAEKKTYKKLEGTTYPGLSGAPAGTNTVALCQAHCDSTSGCNGIVYHNGLNACWITKESTDFSKPVHDNQYTYYYKGALRT